MPKNGKMTREERVFIWKHRYDMTKEQIAAAIGRTKSCVSKFLKDPMI